MKREQLIKKIQSIPAGRFFRIRYTSKVDVAAKFAKEGISITKIVDMTTRTGVRYEKISRAVLSTSDKPSTRKNNWEWVIKNRIKHNTNTGKDYLVVAPITKGQHRVTTYMMTDEKGNTSIVDRDTVAKYATLKNESTPVVMTITLDNILMIK